MSAASRKAPPPLPERTPQQLRLVGEVVTLAERAAQVVAAIKDDESLAAAGEFLTEMVMRMGKKIDETFDPIIDAQKRALEVAKAQKDEVREPVTALEKQIKLAIAAAQQRFREARQRLAERIAKREAEKAEARQEMVENAAANNEPPPEIPDFLRPAEPMALTEPPKVKGVSVTDSWTWEEAIDANLKLRRQYLQVDRGEVTKKVKALGPDAVSVVSEDPNKPAIVVKPMPIVSGRAGK